MKKILCGVLLAACSWSIQAQRNLSVCYGGDATISLENASETDKYKWETKLQDSEGWVTVKDWSSDGFVGLNDLTASLSVRYLIDHPDYDQEADDEVLAAVITVYPRLQAAVIGEAQTICYNTVPSALSVTMAATGGNGVFTGQWQVRADGSSWSDIAGATGSTYSPSALTDTTQYRLKSTSDYGCGDVYSEPVTVTVYADIKAGVIGSAQTICYNTAPSALAFSTGPSGAGGVYTYQWQQSADGSSFADITDATAPTYQAGNLDRTTWYRVAVTSTACGTSATTDAVKIMVHPEFQSGVASGEQTICHNAVPAALTGTACTGGDGHYTYQWEQSSDGSANWVHAQGMGATTLNFTPVALQATTHYRLRYKSGSGCGEDFSNVIKVTVYPQMQAAVIGEAQTICYNTAPSALSVTMAATGGNGVFADQWQSRTDGSSWSDIAGATGSTYSPSALTVTTQYRLKSTSDYGCGDVYAEPVTVTVYADINAGVIGSAQTICYNTAPSALAFSTGPSGAGGVYTYQWQQSADGTAFFDIQESGHDDIYQASKLVDTTVYRVIVTSEKCHTSDTTADLAICVLPEFATGKIAAPDTVCQYEAPRALRVLENCSGADGDYAYQWQQSVNKENFSDIAAEDRQLYQPEALTQTTYYRLQFTSNYGCGVLYSDTVQVFVNPVPLPRDLIGERTVCNNTYDEAYSFVETEDNTLYEWKVIGGEITEQIDDNLIIVHWSPEAGEGTVILDQTYTETSCHSTKDYPVVKTEQAAPDKTHILQKKHSNILICEDRTPGLHYEWGFVELTTGKETIIENSDDQYIEIPHTIDKARYDYFVRTWLNYGERSCGTKTYWDSEILANEFAQDAERMIRIVPNPAKMHFRLGLLKALEEPFVVTIQTVTGQMVYQQSFSACRANESLEFSLPLTPGLYIVVVKTDGKVFTAKMIIE